jgi:hypothetical protein
MDYKYIEQLLDRYWECETTPEEERILRAFFSQEQVPAHLARYAPLFEYETHEAEHHLDDKFDARVLEAIGEPTLNLRVTTTMHVSLARRLRPLFRAAAAVAIVTLIGVATQQTFTSNPTETTTGNPSASFNGTTEEPQKAYEADLETQKLYKEGSKAAAMNDSAKTNRHTTDKPAQQQSIK